MLVKIVTLDRIVLEKEIDSIIVPGIQGQLTILPHHIPLICPLTRGKIKIKSKEEEKIIEIDDGILKVDKEGAKILVFLHGY